MQRVRQAEFARMLGKSPAYVSNLVSKGDIPLGADGLIEVDQAVKAMIAKGDPSMHVGKLNEPSDTDLMREIRRAIVAKSGFGTDAAGSASQDDEGQESDLDSNSVSYQAARTLRETYAARNEKLKYEKDIGLLAETEQVRRGTFTAFRMLRDMLLAVPARCAATANPANPPAAYEAIAAEIRGTLDQFARMNPNMVER